MPGSQNLADVSFNYQQTEKEGALVRAELRKVIADVETLSNTKVTLNSVSGFGELKTVQAQISKTVNDLNASIGKLNTSLDGLSKTTANNTKANIDNEKAKQAQLKTDQEVVKLIAEEDKAEQQSIKTKRLKTQESERTTKQQQKEQKATEDSTNAFKQLELEYKKTAAAAKSLQVTQPGSQAAKDATDKAAALKKQITSINESTGVFTDNVGNYAGKLGGLFQRSFGFLRAAAAAIPGLGLSGIFLLGYEAIVKVVESLGLFDTATSKALETQKKFNDIKREELAIDTQLEEAFKSELNFNNDTGTTQKALENSLALSKAQNKSKEEQLILEKKIADQRALQANQQFNKEGGFDKQQQANLELIGSTDDLLNKQKELKEVLKGGMNAFGKTEASQSDIDAAKQAVADSKQNLDDKIASYTKIKAINEENANALAAQNEKDVEITTYAEEQKRKVILETAKINANTTIEANGRILANEKSTLEQRLKAIKSSATERKEIAKAELNETLNNPATQGTAERIIAYKKYAKEIFAISKTQEVDLFNTKEGYRRRDAQAQLDSDKKVIEARKTIEEQFSTDVNLSLQQRLENAAKVANDEMAIAKEDYATQKDFAIATGKTKKELNDLEVGYNLRVAAINAETQKRITSILKDEIDKRKSLQDGYFSDVSILSSFDSANAAEGALAETQVLSTKFKNGKVSFEEYQKDLNKINKKYQQIQADITIAGLQKQLAYYDKYYPDILTTISFTEGEILKTKQAAEDATTDAAKQAALARLVILEAELKAEKAAAEGIAAVRKSIAETSAKDITASDEDEISKYKAKMSKIANIVGAIFELAQKFDDDLNGIIDNGLQKQLDAIEAVEAAKDKAYDNEKTRIENSTLTQQEQKEALTKLDAQRSAEKDEAARKEAAIKTRQAKLDRDAAVLSIVGSAIAAHFKFLAELGPAGLGFAIASDILAAVQVGVLLAKPLPKFGTGKDKHNKYEGFAITSEAGKAEPIKRADGSIEYDPRPIPKISWVGKDDIVYPDVSSFLKENKYASLTLKTSEMLQRGNATTVSDPSPQLLRDINKGIRDLVKKKLIVRPVMKERLEDTKYYREYFGK